MPIKKVVVKSDADATIASASATAPRKRTPAAKKPVEAAEVAPASGEKKARSSSTKNAVTHRHKKQQQQESAVSALVTVAPEAATSIVAPVASSFVS